MTQMNPNYCLFSCYFIIKRIFFALVVFFMPHLQAASHLSPYSTKELDQLEKEFIQLINQSDSVERDPLANQYINDLGKKLARYSPTKTPHFFIVKSKEINAFAGPGGHIGINTQLILTTANESELAAVMAHEIAHVRLHHLYGMIEHQKQMQIPMLASLLASAALGMINPSMGMGAMMASMGGFSQDSINYTRSKEKEADRIGIDMLIKSGLDPKGMPGFFRKMQQNMRYYYSANLPAILRTHPLDEDRIAEAENRMTHLKKQPYPDSVEYGMFKELIRTSITQDSAQLLEFYDKQCIKQNSQLACQYGRALTKIKNRSYKEAYDLLNSALATSPAHLFLQSALAETELGLGQHEAALKRLETLHNAHPEHYAILLAYTNGLLQARKTDKAIALLLKGSRLYKTDLTLCRSLARAQAQAGKKGYAYFTQSQCLMIEGQKRAAMAELKVAKNLAKGDAYLLARIDAKMEEIRFLSAP